MSSFDSSRGPPSIEGMTSLKVDNLTYRTTVEDLKRYFEKYGELGDIYVPRDRYKNESRGFAFVRFYERRDAEDAMDYMDRKIVDGREIRVQMAKYGRPSESHKPRKYMQRRGRSRSRSPRKRRSRSRSRSPQDHGRPRNRSRSRSPRRRKSRSRSRSPRRRSPSRSRSRSPARRYQRSPSRSRSRSPKRKRSRSRSRSHSPPERQSRNQSRNSRSRSRSRSNSPPERQSRNQSRHSRSRSNSKSPERSPPRKARSLSPDCPPSAPLGNGDAPRDQNRAEED